jgi:hypothetical protein
VSVNRHENGERHSVALSDEIITDPEEKARKDVANALLQVDLVNSMIERLVTLNGNRFGFGQAGFCGFIARFARVLTISRALTGRGL